MEQKLRSGLVLGRLAVLKKKWDDYELLLRPVFFMFSWAKIVFKNIVDGENIFGNRMKLKKYIFFLKS